MGSVSGGTALGLDLFYGHVVHQYRHAGGARWCQELSVINPTYRFFLLTLGVVYTTSLRLCNGVAARYSLRTFCGQREKDAMHMKIMTCGAIYAHRMNTERHSIGVSTPACDQTSGTRRSIPAAWRTLTRSTSCAKAQVMLPGSQPASNTLRGACQCR